MPTLRIVTDERLASSLRRLQDYRYAQTLQLELIHGLEFDLDEELNTGEIQGGETREEIQQRIEFLRGEWERVNSLRNRIHAVVLVLELEILRREGLSAHACIAEHSDREKYWSKISGC